MAVLGRGCLGFSAVLGREGFEETGFRDPSSGFSDSRFGGGWS